MTRDGEGAFPSTWKDGCGGGRGAPHPSTFLRSGGQALALGAVTVEMAWAERASLHFRF